MKFDGQSTWRHLHPCEVAILTGAPPLLNWSKNQRLNLCAVGQQASPLQAVWVAAHALSHVQKQFGQKFVVNPFDCLQGLKHVVFSQTLQLYPPIKRQVQETLTVPIHFDDMTTATPLVCHPGTTVGEILSAEMSFRNDGMPLVAFTMPAMEPLDFASPVTPHPIRICQAWTPVHSPVQLSLATEEGYELVTLEVAATAPDDDDMLPASSNEPLHERPAEHEHALDLDASSHADAAPDDALQLVPVTPQPFDHLDTKHDPTGLIGLSGEQLLHLLPPMVTSEASRQAVRYHLIPRDTRLAILSQEQTIMADDELLWHMTRLVLQHGDHTCMVLDPLTVLGLIRFPFAEVPCFPAAATTILTAVWHSGHWTPIVWTRSAEELRVHIWEVDEVDLTFLTELHGKMCEWIGLSRYVQFIERRQFGLQHCGAAALAFVHSMLDLDFRRPQSEETLVHYHGLLSSIFWTFLQSQQSVSRPWIWGTGPSDPATMLTAVLQLHGVPPAHSTTRAKLAIQSLGKETIVKCLHSPSPWRSLKQAANQLVPPFQLVLADELAAKVNAQDPKKSRKKRDTDKSKVRGPWTMPTELDPQKLRLQPNTFCTANSDPITQISMNQVGPLATGVALTTLSEAQQFLSSGQLVTSHGLALLVLNCEQDLQTALNWQTIRFAATCSANGEPVLLRGHLVQLGQLPVGLIPSQDAAALSKIEVACCKITIFRDQWDQTWEDFQEHPFRFVLSAVPALQTCRQDPCDCEKWHPTAACDTAAVLDVFRRQFFTDAGKPVRADKSSQFGVLIRYVKSLETVVLQQSGVGGLYVEPRTEDGSGPSLDYQVIWMANASFQEVQHRAQVEVHSLGIARNGARYGIRVAAANYQAVFSSLKPDALFLPPGPRVSWLCGPWPYGADRKALGKIFKQWKWEARPTQVAHSVLGGLMWNVQSVSDPPQTVYSLSHGQVVISRAEGPEVPIPPRKSAAGPAPTLKLCQVATSNGVDPLQAADPWGSALQKHAVPLPAPSGKPQLQELEERLEKTILSKLPAQNMDVDSNDARITDLESKLQHLASRQMSLESTVHANQAESTMQMQNLQAQVMNQLEGQGRKLQCMFDDQMARMESILSKKGRFE